MRDILVLSARANDFNLISQAVDKTHKIKDAKDIETAIALHNHFPFDLIIADLDLLEQTFGNTASNFLKNPFTKTNSFVRFVVLCAKEEVEKAVRAVNEGAIGYLTYPIEENEVQLLLDSIDRTLSRDFELDYLRDHFWKTEWLEIIRSKNPRMKKIYESIRSVSPTIATVLLLGDTGTGKGMLARLVHWHSQRCEAPFIAVHCGAIPDTLIESELFGHEKGAFTGADRRKPGKFEMARGGTIFLDEIGTITASAQIKLLQVLQDGTFSRLGSTTLMNSDLRIIAATNADLADLVQKGGFRKDLYYRLNIFPIEIPLLRERLEDLPNLTEIFLKKLNAKYGKDINGLHPSVIEGFRQYEWPGNIRELENILERAYILETSSILSAQNFPPEMVRPCESDPLSEKNPSSLAQARQIAVEVFEKAYLTVLLGQTKGKINLAARKADIT
ncbi:MAG: Fis family transcriptional regulator, partial [Desulfobacula sp. RIFOXYB2_FULL_45_6]